MKTLGLLLVIVVAGCAHNWHPVAQQYWGCTADTSGLQFSDADSAC